MSDAEDTKSQTEEATEKKISDTLEKGNSPVSRDAGVIALFLGFLLSMSFVIENSGAAWSSLSDWRSQAAINSHFAMARTRTHI